MEERGRGMNQCQHCHKEISLFERTHLEVVFRYGAVKATESTAAAKAAVVRRTVIG